MSDIDLTAATDTAVRAYFDEAGVHFDAIGPFDQNAATRCMTAAVTAAAPLIEAAVREQVAREYEQRADLIRQQRHISSEWQDGKVTGLIVAARAARGGAR